MLDGKWHKPDHSRVIFNLLGADEDDERALLGAGMVAAVLDLVRRSLTENPKSRYRGR